MSDLNKWFDIGKYYDRVMPKENRVRKDIRR
jgi:hypothetical protein